MTPGWSHTDTGFWVAAEAGIAVLAAFRTAHLSTALTVCSRRNGIIECPATADVQMLKRLFQYQAHNKLLPALQVGLCDALADWRE